jgi:acetylornithine/succinyldiaminopimelate/putrescine aminotransferase
MHATSKPPRSSQLGRVRIIAFDNAFHGRTLGALSMTGTPKYREGFGDLGAVRHVPYGDLGAVEAALGADVAGIIVEPVQGESGIVPALSLRPRRHRRQVFQPLHPRWQAEASRARSVGCR